MLDELIPVALIGTQRQKVEIPMSFSDSLNKMLSQLNSPEAEGNLLSATAILALYKRAGKTPNKLETKLVEPCSLEDLPVCSAKIAHFFLLALSREFTKVLGEFLDLLNKSSKRLPDKYLFLALKYGSSNTEVREAICKVIGKRGQWLAEHNPSWSYAKKAQIDGISPEEIWQTGNKLTRITLLKKLRKEDPTKARELVLSTWKEEAADQRFATISLFKENLSLDDEPFLETALGDRAKDTRQEAQKLLFSLSDSKINFRMLQRLSSAITLKIEKKKTLLEINLPDQLDEAFAKDVVEIDPPNKSIGQKAWWVRKMVMSANPKCWVETLKLSAIDSLSLIAKSDWDKDILIALPYAIANHSDKVWAEIFFDWCVEKKRLPENEPTERMFSMFSHEEKEKLLKLLLEKDEKFYPTNLTGKLLQLHNSVWSKDLLTIILTKGLETIRSSKKIDWGWTYFFENIAICAPESTFDEIIFLFDEKNFTEAQWKIWEKPIDTLVGLIKFRQKMLKEFSR